MATTPRTTNRFVPGYDWNMDAGFFDENASATKESLEDTLGSWVPDVDNDDDNNEKKVERNDCCHKPGSILPFLDVSVFLWYTQDVHRCHRSVDRSDVSK